MKNLAEKIKEMIAEELEIDINEVHDDSDLNELGLDSLTFLEMFADFKEEFNFNITINEINEHLQNKPVTNIKELIEFVENFISDLKISSEELAEALSIK